MRKFATPTGGIPWVWFWDGLWTFGLDGRQFTLLLVEVVR